jgi:hypothetical protein
MIEDMMVSANISGDSQNQIHMETNVVRSVDTVGNIVTLQLPLAHTYDAAYAPKMIRCISAVNAGHINPHITYKVRQTDNNRHAMQLLHARSCFVSNLKVMGEPAPIPGNSLGSRGHGLRIGDGCIFNWVENVEVQRPAFWDAAQGYGCTFYSGARANRLSHVTTNGCRHSVLFFKGVSDNVVEDVTSIDCRGTDIDFHGANERKNHVRGVKIVGGSSSTPDINLKAALKFGNPTHRAGCSLNTVTDVELTDYPGYAVHFLPGKDNLVKNIRGKSNRGYYFQYLTDDATLPMTGCWVEEGKQYGGVKHVEAEGGPNRVITGCGVRALRVMDAPMTGLSYDLANMGKFTLDDCGSIRAGVDISSYIIQAVNILELEVLGFTGDGAKRGMLLTNCPNALIESPKWSNQSERVPVYDGGGNDNAKFIDYECKYVPAFVDAGAGSPGMVRRPRRFASKKAVSALAFPVALTGAGNQINPGAALPGSGAGSFIMTASIQPKAPKSKIKFRAVFPYIQVDLTNTHVATVYYRNVYNGLPASGFIFAGIAVARVTGGANAGQSLIVEDEFFHNIEDLLGTVEVTVRLGNASATAQTILGNTFATKDWPYLLMEEGLDA